MVEISGGGDLMSSVQGLNFLPGFALEGFPNRDSTVYKELYGINHATTVLRGTLRFKGYSDTIQGMQLLGLIDPNPDPILHPNGPDITWVCFSKFEFKVMNLFVIFFPSAYVDLQSFGVVQRQYFL